MSDLRNEFSWSWSRHRTFEKCLRRYWLSHYGSWGGWEASAPDEVREAYIQKKLATRPQWVGTLVHEAAEYVLVEVRQGRNPEPRKVVEQFRRLARRQIEDSLQGRYRYFPKRYVGFVDHYYDQEVPEVTWDATVQSVVEQVAGLFDNPVFLRLVEVPERIREVERLEQLRIGDVPVWVSLDVLVEDGRGGLVVVDWKTGRAHDPDAITGQLGVYGVYVLSRYLRVAPERRRKRDLDRVKTMYVNLRSGERAVYALTGAHVDEAIELIRASAARMRALVPVEGERPDPKDFPMLSEGDPACDTCSFRRTCGR